MNATIMINKTKVELSVETKTNVLTAHFGTELLHNLVDGQLVPNGQTVAATPIITKNYETVLYIHRMPKTKSGKVLEGLFRQLELEIYGYLNHANKTATSESEYRKAWWSLKSTFETVKDLKYA